VILEVPTPDDFRDHGVDYLNIGWGTVLDILISLEDAGHYSDSDYLNEIKVDYWQAAERELATALSLIEQGAEFLLKGRICAVSPWLLITRNPVEWPRGSHSSDVNFAAFRTIDAQDLAKVHDTFSSKRLDEEFGRAFDCLRQRRNSIIHTVDKNMKLAAGELIEQVLLVSEHLLGPQAWLKIRMEFLGRDRHTAIYPDGNDYRAAREFLAVVKLLGAANLKRFFDYNKKQRSYLCPSCSRQDWDYDGKTAQLRPNSPSSTNLYCFACSNDFAVTRASCPHSGCKGNVYDPDFDCCLTCSR
jgi:hypothetical protein